MLLYSTTLKINDTLTKDKFIELVIRWNQLSPHADNVIPGLVWNGERNRRFESEFLWLDIEEYRNENIIAARFEKQEDDGAIWDTDFIMNFNSMKMTIQLDRGYTEDAQMENLQFSTPHFVTMLIDGGYLAPDHDLPVLRQAVTISESNLSLLINVINRQADYRLPVVYVSKTVDNRNPVNINWLCSKLKGAAHILLQEDKRTNEQIRTSCNDNNEYFGGIGIYFPNGRHKRILYRNYADSDNVLLNKVTRAVFQYMNAQKLPLLSIWQGVNNALLQDRYASKKAEKDEAEIARKKAESEIETYIGAFDEDNAKLRQRVEELGRENASLQMENQGLRDKLNNIEEVPVLFIGDEEEFYQGEIKEMILDAVEAALKNTAPKARRRDVLNDILKNNHYQKIGDKRERIIKALFKDYKTLSASMRQQLYQLGFKITEDGKHYRLTYFGDERYKTTLSKSGSDWREGKNVAAEILKSMM
ncbi:hypothetical protein DXA59_05515 [Clostridium sp. OF03-18AA]|nr:hypothetical protein DXA59_05515 [Clostridium sp. OF03-18AA]